jgi:hypothetical protein
MLRSGGAPSYSASTVDSNHRPLMINASSSSSFDFGIRPAALFVDRLLSSMGAGPSVNSNSHPAPPDDDDDESDNDDDDDDEDSDEDEKTTTGYCTPTALVGDGDDGTTLSSYIR